MKFFLSTPDDYINDTDYLYLIISYLIRYMVPSRCIRSKMLRIFRFHFGNSDKTQRNFIISKKKKLDKRNEDRKS